MTIKSCSDLLNQWKTFLKILFYLPFFACCLLSHRNALSAVHSTPARDNAGMTDELIPSPKPLLKAKSESLTSPLPPDKEVDIKLAASDPVPDTTQKTLRMYILTHPHWKSVLRDKGIDALFCLHRDLRSDDYYVFNFLLDQVHATTKREEDDTLLTRVIERLDYPLTLEWARKQYESNKTFMNKEKAGSWEALVAKWQKDLEEWWSWHL